MKIGLMGAMEQEIIRLKGGMKKVEKVSIGRREFFHGESGAHEVVLAFSGWGKVSAAALAATMIVKYGVEGIIFTGLAGALDPSLERGDMVIGDRLVQHDMDASAVPGIQRFEVPLLGIQFFAPPTEYVDLAVRAAEAYLGEDMRNEVAPALLEEFGIDSPKVVRGLIASGDQFIASTKVADALRRDLPGVMCVEMEGAAVAQVAVEHGIPFIILRTISDKADQAAAYDFPRFLERVASHFTCGAVFKLLEILEE